jgi:hypothetical protein
MYEQPNTQNQTAIHNLHNDRQQDETFLRHALGHVAEVFAQSSDENTLLRAKKLHEFALLAAVPELRAYMSLFMQPTYNAYQTGELLDPTDLPS